MLPLFVLAAKPIEDGAYALPELCRRLTAATGVTHYAGALRDYPVLVITKSGDPKRVESLVAKALRAEWTKEQNGVRLSWATSDRVAEFKVFSELATKDMTPKARLRHVPLRDLYELPVGSMMRYGSGAYDNKPCPVALTREYGATTRLLVRRAAYGAFESKVIGESQVSGVFTSDSELNLNSLPAEVERELVAQGADVPLKEEDLAWVKRLSAMEGISVDWDHLDQNDPSATLFKPMVGLLSSVLKKDCVMVTPDLGLFGIFQAVNKPTLKGLLGCFSIAVNWTVSDNALVGMVPTAERRFPTQFKRAVLANYIWGVRQSGVMNSPDLARYVTGQNPGASDSWADVLPIVMAQVIIDQKFLGDFPYNHRLYSAFTDQDWQILRQGSVTPVAVLSAGSQSAMRALLLQARDRLMSDKLDPAMWPSLAPERLRVSVSMRRDRIIAIKGNLSRSVEDLSNFAQSIESPGEEARPITVRPGTRTTYELSIFPATGQHEPVKTGFVAIDFDAGTTFVTPDKLSASVKAEIARAKSKMPTSTAPPPVRTEPPLLRR